MVEIVTQKLGDNITPKVLEPMGLQPDWLNGGSLRKLDNKCDDAFVQFETRKSGTYTYDCSLKMGDETESLRMDFSLRTLDDRKQVIEVKTVEVFNETLNEVVYSADLSANHHVNRATADKLFKAFGAFSQQSDHSSMEYAFQKVGLSRDFSLKDAFRQMNSPVFKEIDEESRVRLHGNRLQADATARKVAVQKLG